MRRFAISAVLLALGLILTPIASRAEPAGDWGATRDPFDKQVVARYKAILANQPHDAPALAKLVALYRRYRTLGALQQDYQNQLDREPNNWAALVVLGRLLHTAGDDARAREMWTRAVAANAADSETWIAIGELDKAAGKTSDARSAYDSALAHATTKDLKRKALRSLADLTLAAGDSDAANAYFRTFLELDPNNAQLWIERGDAMLGAGKREVALESYRAAEKLLAGDPSRRVEVIARYGQALEAMAEDDKAATEYRRAIKLSPKGYFLEAELTERIIDIYRRKQALPALVSEYETQWPESARRHFEWNTLGKLYEETGAQDKAIAALRRAVAISAGELETQRRLIALLENSGRDDEALAQYEAVARAAPGQQRFQLELAERYWRRGQPSKALDVLRRLQQRFPNDPGALAAIATLYQTFGKEDLAIALYERLAKLEPDDIGHLVALGEQYFQRGDKARALAAWTRIVAQKTAASYAKLGEVLVDHGSAYYDEAEKNYNAAISAEPNNVNFRKGRAALYDARKEYKRSLDEWDQVMNLLGADSTPHSLLGSAATVAPLATGGSPRRGGNPWRGMPAGDPGKSLSRDTAGGIASTDRPARREVRRRIVALLSKLHSVETERTAKWRAALQKTDVPGTRANSEAIEAAYYLVEYFSRPGNAQAGQPLATLIKLVAMVPDDYDCALDLVKAYRTARRFDDSVALALKVAAATPNREREIYKLISEIKAEARRDDEAIEWQQKALAKSPNDPSTLEGLGQRYAAMQKVPEAIAAYEQVLKLNPQRAEAGFVLAQLYLQNGATAKASQVLRQILRTATDEDLIARAGERAIDLAELTDTLGELERVASPLAFMMASKPVYRRLLVQLYLRYVPRLASRIRRASEEIQKSARSELDQIGTRGLRPLLEALRDDSDAAQQRIAVQVLGYLGNKAAAAPLVHMARARPDAGGPAQAARVTVESPDRETRVEALVAAGRLGDPGIIREVLPLIDHSDAAVREAAIFALGRTADRHAIPPLLKAMRDRQPSVRALACLGLAQIGAPPTDARGPVSPARSEETRNRVNGRIDLPPHSHDGSAVTLATLGSPRRGGNPWRGTHPGDPWKSPTRGIAGVIGPALIAAITAPRPSNDGPSDNDLVRAACAYAIGAQRIGDATPALIGAVGDNHGETQRVAAWALGQLRDPQALAPLVRAYFSRAGAPASEILWAIGRISGGQSATFSLEDFHAYPTRAGRFDLATAIANLTSAPAPAPQISRVAVEHTKEVATAITEALGRHPDAIASVLADLDGAADQLTLGALTPSNDDATAAAAITAIAAAIESAVAVQLHAADPKLRALAVSALAKINPAEPAIATAISDPDTRVRLAAMTSVGIIAGKRGSLPAPSVSALEAALRSRSWEDRRGAALALGQLGAAHAEALAHLANDESSFVREAVAMALAGVGQSGAMDALRKLARDPIPQVRDAAVRSLDRNAR